MTSTTVHLHGENGTHPFVPPPTPPPVPVIPKDGPDYHRRCAFAAMKSINISREVITEHLRDHFGVASLSDLTEKQWAQAAATVQAWSRTPNLAQFSLDEARIRFRLAFSPKHKPKWEKHNLTREYVEAYYFAFHGVGKWSELPEGIKWQITARVMAATHSNIVMNGLIRQIEGE
jgi:hypothetical protein